ncbi:MAG: tetratricopeptide repeat protein [Kofleriaceae bacterium]|nr:tetratricopeptide repeat protein [Kofleriaceae bacterium]
MAKNKGTHGRGKVDPELLEPDEFVQTVNSLSDRLAPHWKKLAIGGGLIAAGIVAWQVMGWMHDKSARQATDSYAQAMKVLDRPVVGPDETAPETAVPVEPFSTEEARRSAGLDALAAVRSEHGNMGLSALTLPREAKLLLESGRFDDASAAYAKVVKSSVPDAIRMSAREGIGYSLEAKAMAEEDPGSRQSGLEKALKAFADIQPNEGGPMRDY